MVDSQTVGHGDEPFVSDLKLNLSPMIWQTWFEPLRFEVQENTLSVIAPSDLHSRWVRDKHEEFVRSFAAKHFSADIVIEYLVSDIPPADDP